MSMRLRNEPAEEFVGRRDKEVLFNRSVADTQRRRQEQLRIDKSKSPQKNPLEMTEFELSQLPYITSEEKSIWWTELKA